MVVSQRRGKKCKSVPSMDNEEENTQNDYITPSNESELVKDISTIIDVERTTNSVQQVVVVTYTEEEVTLQTQQDEQENQAECIVSTIDEILPVTPITNQDLEDSSTTPAVVVDGSVVDDELVQNEQQQQQQNKIDEVEQQQQQLEADHTGIDQTQPELFEEQKEQDKHTTQLVKENDTLEEKDKIVSTLVADVTQQQQSLEQQQQEQDTTNTFKERSSDDKILDSLCKAWIPGPSELTNNINSMKNNATTSSTDEQSFEYPIETTLVSNNTDENTADGSNILITSAITDDGIPLAKTDRSITTTTTTIAPIPEQVQELELIVQEQAAEITLLKVMYESIQREMNDKTNEISNDLVTCQKQFIEQSNIIQLIQNTYEEKYVQQCNEVNVLKQFVTKRNNDIDVLVQECKNNTIAYTNAHTELVNAKQLLCKVCNENQLLYKSLQVLQNEWDTTAQQYVIDLEEKMNVVTNNIHDISIQKDYYITEKKQQQISTDKMGKVVVDLVNQFELVQEQVLQYIDTMNNTNDYIRYEHSDRLVQQNEHYTLIQSLYFRLNHVEMLLEHYEDDVKTVKRNVHTTHTQLLNNISTHNTTTNSNNNSNYNTMSPSPIPIPPYGGATNYSSSSGAGAGGAFLFNKNYNSINNKKLQPLDPVLSPKVTSPTSIGSTTTNKSIFDDCIGTNGTGTITHNHHDNKNNNTNTKNSSTNDTTINTTNTDNNDNYNNNNNTDTREYHENILGYSRPHEISMLGTENSKLKRLAHLVTIQLDMISSKQTMKLASSSTCTSHSSNSNNKDIIMKGNSTSHNNNNMKNMKRKNIHNNLDIDIDDLVTNGLQMRLRAIENIKSKLKEQIDIIQITKSALTERNAYDDYYDDNDNHDNDNVNNNSSTKNKNNKKKSFVGSDHSCLGNGHNTLRDIEYKIKVWNKLYDDNNMEVLLLSEELQQQKTTSSNDTTTNNANAINDTTSTSTTSMNNEIEQQVQLWIARAEKIQINLQYHSDDVQYIKKQIFNSKVLYDDVYHADIDTIMVRKTELNILLEQTRTQGSKIDRILLQLNNIVTNTTTNNNNTFGSAITAPSDTTNNNNDNPALSSTQLQQDEGNNNTSSSSSSIIDPTIYNTFNNIKYTIYELDIQIDTLLNDVTTMIDKRTNLYNIEITKINKQLSRIQSIEEKFNIQTYEMTQVFMKHSKLLHPNNNINNSTSSTATTGRSNATGTSTIVPDNKNNDDDNVVVEQTSIPNNVSSTGTFTSNCSSHSSSTSSSSEKHGDHTSRSGSSQNSGGSHSSGCSSTSTKTGTSSHSSTSTTSTTKSKIQLQQQQQQQQQQHQQQQRSLSLSPNKRKQYLFRYDYSKEIQLIQQQLQQQQQTDNNASSLQQQKEEDLLQVVHAKEELEELEERVDTTSCRRSDDVYNQYENGYEQRE